MFPHASMMTAGGSSQALFWNPSDKDPNTTLLNSNLTSQGDGTGAVRATVGKSSGKWYFEVYVEYLTGTASVGVCTAVGDLNAAPGSAADGANVSIGYQSGGSVWSNSSGIAVFTSYGAGSLIMVAFDMGARKLWFGKNGTWLTATPGTGGHDLNASTYFPVVGFGSGTNTGQLTARQPLAYLPPAGFIPYA